MFKKISLIALAVLVSFGAVSCSKAGKYADIKTVMGEMIKAYDGFSASVEKVKEAKDLAAALDKLTADMEKLAPKMKELEKKYPEMKSQDVPAELKPEMTKLEESGKKLFAALMNEKNMKFMADPAVKAAQEKFQKAMASLGEK